MFVFHFLGLLATKPDPGSTVKLFDSQPIRAQSAGLVARMINNDAKKKKELTLVFNKQRNKELWVAERREYKASNQAVIILIRIRKCSSYDNVLKC